MLPDRFPPDDPREWLNRARGTLDRARIKQPGGYFEDPCYDAQQAAEKAIKGLLIAKGIAFPYVHDVARLLTLLEQSGERVPASLADADGLTRYALVTRYPGLSEAVTEEEYEQAVSLAELVVAWAEARVEALRNRPPT